MIVMRIKGGIGNQLFQYAFAYSLSKKTNQRFFFDPSFTNKMTKRGYKLTDFKVASFEIVCKDKLPYKIRIIKNAYFNKFFRIINCMG